MKGLTAIDYSVIAKPGSFKKIYQFLGTYPD